MTLPVPSDHLRSAPCWVLTLRVSWTRGEVNTRQIITIVPGSVYQAVYMSSASQDIVPLSIFMNFQAFIESSEILMT